MAGARGIENSAFDGLQEEDEVEAKTQSHDDENTSPSSTSIPECSEQSKSKNEKPKPKPVHSEAVYVLKTLNTKLLNEISLLREELAAVKAPAKVKAVYKQLFTTKKQLFKAREKIETIEEEKNVLLEGQKNVENLSFLKEKYEGSIAILKDENQKLMNELDELLDSSKSLKKDNSMLTQLMKEVDDTFQIGIAEKEKENVSLAETEKIIDDFQRNYDEVKEKYTTLLEEYERINHERIVEQKHSAERHEELSQEIQGLWKENEKLLESRKKLQTTVHNHEEDVTVQQQKVNDLLKMQQEYSSKIEIMTKENERLSNSCPSESFNELQKLSRKLGSIINENDVLIGENQRLKDLEIELGKIKTKYSNLFIEMEIISEDNERLNRSLSSSTYDNEDEIEKLNTNIENEMKQMEKDFTDIISHLNQTLKQKDEEIEALVVMQSQHKRTLMEYAELKQDFDRFTAEVNVDKQIRKENDASFLMLKKEYEMLTNVHQSTLSDLDKLKADITWYELQLPQRRRRSDEHGDQDEAPVEEHSLDYQKAGGYRKNEADGPLVVGRGAKFLFDKGTEPRNNIVERPQELTLENNADSPDNRSVDSPTFIKVFLQDSKEADSSDEEGNATAPLHSNEKYIADLQHSLEVKQAEICNLKGYLKDQEEKDHSSRHYETSINELEGIISNLEKAHSLELQGKDESLRKMESEMKQKKKSSFDLMTENENLHQIIVKLESKHHHELQMQLSLLEDMTEKCRSTEETCRKLAKEKKKQSNQEFEKQMKEKEDKVTYFKQELKNSLSRNEDLKVTSPVDKDLKFETTEYHFQLLLNQKDEEISRLKEKVQIMNEKGSVKTELDENDELGRGLEQYTKMNEAMETQTQEQVSDQLSRNKETEEKIAYLESELVILKKECVVKAEAITRLESDQTKNEESVEELKALLQWEKERLEVCQEKCAKEKHESDVKLMESINELKEKESLIQSMMQKVCNAKEMEEKFAALQAECAELSEALNMKTKAAEQLVDNQMRYAEMIEELNTLLAQEKEEFEKFQLKNSKDLAEKDLKLTEAAEKLADEKVKAVSAYENLRVNEESLTLQQDRIKYLETLLHEKENMVTAHITKRLDYEQKMEEQRNELKYLSSQLELLEQANGERKDRKESMEKELATMSQQVEDLLSRREEDINQYKDMITDLEGQVDTLSNKLEGGKERYQSEVEYLQLALENRTQELETAQDAIKEKEGIIKKQKSNVRILESTIMNQSSHINRTSSEIEHLQADLESANRKYDALRADYDSGKRQVIRESQISVKDNRIVSFNEDVTFNRYSLVDFPPQLHGSDFEYFQMLNELSVKEKANVSAEAHNQGHRKSSDTNSTPAVLIDETVIQSINEHSVMKENDVIDELMAATAESQAEDTSKSVNNTEKYKVMIQKEISYLDDDGDGEDDVVMKESPKDAIVDSYVEVDVPHTRDVHKGNVKTEKTGNESTSPIVDDNQEKLCVIRDDDKSEEKLNRKSNEKKMVKKIEPNDCCRKCVGLDAMNKTLTLECEKLSKEIQSYAWQLKAKDIMQSNTDDTLNKTQEYSEVQSQLVLDLQEDIEKLESLIIEKSEQLEEKEGLVIKIKESLEVEQRLGQQLEKMLCKMEYDRTDAKNRIEAQEKIIEDDKAIAESTRKYFEQEKRELQCIIADLRSDSSLQRKTFEEKDIEIFRLNATVATSIEEIKNLRSINDFLTSMNQKLKSNSESANKKVVGKLNSKKEDIGLAKAKDDDIVQLKNALKELTVKYEKLKSESTTMSKEKGTIVVNLDQYDIIDDKGETVSLDTHEANNKNSSMEITLESYYESLKQLFIMICKTSNSNSTIEDYMQSAPCESVGKRLEHVVIHLNKLLENSKVVIVEGDTDGNAPNISGNSNSSFEDDAILSELHTPTTRDKQCQTGGSERSANTKENQAQISRHNATKKMLEMKCQDLEAASKLIHILKTEKESLCKSVINEQRENDILTIKLLRLERDSVPGFHVNIAPNLREKDVNETQIELDL